MTGHEPILAMRRRGLSPRFVWVKECPGFHGDGMTVCLAEGESPETQDWRFLVGLTALVEGDSSERIARIARCVAPIAERVIATYADPLRQGPRRYESVRITDTQGVLDWQK